MRLVTLDTGPGPGGQPLFVEFVNTLHWYDGAPIELIASEAELAAGHPPLEPLQSLGQEHAVVGGRVAM
jgi:hypothetical protein